MFTLPYHPRLWHPLLCLFVLCLYSCVSDTYREQNDPIKREGGKEPSGREEPMYKDLEPSLTSTTGTWAGNYNLKAKAAIRSMKLVFDLDLSPFKKSMVPLSENKKDTFAETLLKMEVLFNGQPILFEIPDPEKSWLLKTSMYKRPGERMDFESTVFSLYASKNLQLSVPLFVLSGTKAGSTGTISVRVWQDMFIGPERKITKKADFGPEMTTYYNDTLKTKLIDNTYSFSFTVPQIYRTDIVCDSIILQDDQNWSPGGSDNTLWKSTYPDIYFSISDLYGQAQNSSTTQKSTGKYTEGDTLSFYHYSPSEPFTITVYDYDVLSNDDVLGYWSGDLGDFKNNASYSLNFGHVKPFFFRKKEFGQLNK